MLGNDAGVVDLEAHRSVDPDAVDEPHLGPAVVAGAVSEEAQRDLQRERGVGVAAGPGGAEEGDDLVGPLSLLLPFPLFFQERRPELEEFQSPRLEKLLED